MKIKLLFLLFIASLYAFNSYSINPTDFGARGNGIGNANTTQIDLFSIYTNQAALAYLDKKQVGAFSESRYLVNELSTYGVAVVLPAKVGVFGVSLSRFGYQSFNQTQIGAAYAKKLARDVSIGFQVNHFTTQIEGFQSKSVVYAELGMLTKITDKITLGAHLFNVTRPKLGSSQNQKTSSILKLGVSYFEPDKYRLFFDLNKSIDEEINAKTGVEYYILKTLCIRAGVNTIPSQFFGGIGVLANQLSIDISTSYLNDLGFTPSVSLKYAF